MAILNSRCPLTTLLNYAYCFRAVFHWSTDDFNITYVSFFVNKELNHYCTLYLVIQCFLRKAKISVQITLPGSGATGILRLYFYLGKGFIPVFYIFRWCYHHVSTVIITWW